MALKERSCEKCWIDRRQMTRADVHIDDRDLCRACCETEGLDLADGAIIEHLAPEPARPSSSRPMLVNDGKRARRTDLAVRSQEEQDAEHAKFVAGARDLAPRVCQRADCARTFVTRAPNQKYCSEDCHKLVVERKRQAAQANQPRPAAAGPRSVPPGLAPRPCVADGCTTSYTPKHASQKYCSNRCLQRQWQREHAPHREPRTCALEGCGQQFVPATKRSVFCSPGCRAKAWYRAGGNAVQQAHYRAQRVALEPKICADPYCAQTFTPRRAYQRFCSRACCQRVSGRTTYQPAGAIAARACASPRCGKQFTPKNARGLFCSIKCRNAMRYPEGRQMGPRKKTVAGQVRALAAAAGTTPAGFARAMNAGTPSAAPAGVSGQGTVRLKSRPLQSAAATAQLNDESVRMMRHPEATCSIHVSPAGLDRWWNNLTLERKASLMEQEMARA